MTLLIAGWSAWIPVTLAVCALLLLAFCAWCAVRYDPWRALARCHAAPGPPQGTVLRRCSARFGRGEKSCLSVDVAVSPAGVQVDYSHPHHRPPGGRPLLLPWTGIRSAVVEKLLLSKPVLTLVFLEGTVACWLQLPADALAAVRESAGPRFASFDAADLFARN